jgi:nucleoside-diphosphate-sugar epimerase
LWNPEVVEAFAPTVVANFAFRTRDKLALLGPAKFEEENLQLINQMAFSLKIPSVRMGLTISSGAVLDAAAGRKPDLYGELKALEEEVAQSFAGKGKNIVVARVFSVSGPFVSRVSDYAFSDLVSKAIKGRIEVTSDRKTFRRYVSVGDLLEVALRTANHRSAIIESGGELVELADLAELIRELVNPDADIYVRENRGTFDEDNYASDNSSWTDSTQRLGLVAKTTSEQILDVEKFLRLHAEA